MDNNASTMLSGGFERRRGYLTHCIFVINQLAVTSVIGIFGYVLKDNRVFEENRFDFIWLSTHIPLAGSLSSVIILIQRWYAYLLDDGIIRIYPAIYLCERLICHEKVCTVKSPVDSGFLNRQQIIDNNYVFIPIKNQEFGPRGHDHEDNLARSLICLFIIVSGFCVYQTFSVNDISRENHKLIFCMINLVVQFLAFIGIWKVRLKWSRKSVDWPIPKTSLTETILSQDDPNQIEISH